MARDLQLISDAEREAVLDALQRRADAGQLSPAELSTRTARVHAAQTHAGLDSVLMDLPPEPPRPRTAARQPPPRVVPHVEWQLHTIILGAAAVLAAFIVAVYIARSDDDPSPQVVAPPPTSVPAPTTRPTTTLPPTTTVPPSTTTPPPTRPPVEIRPVEIRPVALRVGPDVRTGRYLSVTTPCYWERVVNDSLMANDHTTAGHTIVDVLPTDTHLRSAHCEWKPYAPPAAPAATFGNGDWLVGEDVEPGRYRSTKEGHPPCSWERAMGFSQDPLTVIATEVAPGQGTVEVTLVAGQRFTSRYCGTWTKVG